MIIYKITNIQNDKVYIGQTVQTLNSRKCEHRNRARQRANYPLYNALNKYGFSSFKMEVIDSAVSQEELDDKEIYYIELYNSMHPKGYNLTKGGAGTIGYKHTEEDKVKMSKLKEGMFKGRENPFYGKTHTKEQREKWSKERKGKILSEEHKKKISATRKRIPVINMDTGEVFESARHAVRYYGKDPDGGTAGYIAKVCKKVKNRNTCMGYAWEYYNPEIHDNTVPSISFLTETDEGVTTIRKE